MDKKERGRSGKERFGGRGTWEIWEKARALGKREKLGKHRDLGNERRRT